MNAINEHERTLLQRRFSEEEMREVEKFFSPFSTTGQIYLSHLLLAAKAFGKNFQEIMTACRGQWEEIWKHGTPDRIGDTDDVAPSVGLRNTAAFFTLYKELGIPLPRTL